MNKKYFLILIVFAAISAYAIPYINALAVNYELSVPIPGETGTITGEQGPPQYILMLFRFSLAIAGLLALGMIIFGAIQYTTSAGNVSGQQDAKDRITSAIYGLILLVGATLILTTINPDLALLKWEEPAPITGEQLSPETIKWGEAYRKIMAAYRAELKQLEQERAKIEQERKIAEADSKEAATILAAMEKDPSISPKNLLSLRIKNEEKIIMANERLVERTNNDLEFAQIELKQVKLDISNYIATSANKYLDRKTVVALETKLNTWLHQDDDVGTFYTTDLGDINNKNMIGIDIDGKISIVSLESGQYLESLMNTVYQWQSRRRQLKEELDDAQKALKNNGNNLIKYQNELQTLNSQSQPK